MSTPLRPGRAERVVGWIVLSVAWIVAGVVIAVAYGWIG